MCSILAGTALALTAAGAATSMAAQQKADKAMRGAQVAETVRQREYQNQADAFFGKSLEKATVESQGRQLADEQAERAAAYAASESVPEALPSLPTSGTDGSPRVIANEMSRALEKGKRFTRQQASAQSRLAGYDDLNLANSIFNGRQVQQLGTIANFARGSAGVLPYEMQAASRKGDSLKNISHILSALGTVAGLGAAYGGLSAAGTAKSGANAAKTVADTGAAAATSPWADISWIASDAGLGNAMWRTPLNEAPKWGATSINF